MTIQKCTIDGCEYLTEPNKELIHAEGSDNTMTIKELEQRIKNFFKYFMISLLSEIRWLDML